MPFSDQLLTLSNQAKELRASAEAVQQRNEAQIARRRVELRAAIDAHNMKVGEQLAAAGNDATDDIDFAIHSIKRAEYTILDAIRDAMVARAEADAKAAAK
jgi:hypothetical protein